MYRAFWRSSPAGLSGGGSRSGFGRGTVGGEYSLVALRRQHRAPQLEWAHLVLREPGLVFL